MLTYLEAKIIVAVISVIDNGRIQFLKELNRDRISINQVLTK